MSPPASVLVLGAGINGLCTARALARRGIDVTVVERGPVPCPLAASADHHRLIRHAYADMPGYARRMPDAFAAWARLFADLAGPASRYYVETGVLTLSRAAADHGARTAALYDRLGLDHKRLDGPAALAARLPHLETEGLRAGVIAPGGALMANRILADLADHLRERGVRLFEHSPVASARPDGAVRLEDGRRLEADIVVAACGTELPRLAPSLAGDLRPQRTLILYADPPDDLAEAWTGAPCWSGLATETDLWGIAPVAGLGVKLGCGALGRDDATDDRRATPAEAEAMAAAYRGVFRGIDRFRPRFAQANHWTLGPGERFRLAAEGRLIALSADSGHGFKFGALTGEDVAEAIVEGAVERVSRRLAAAEPEPEPAAS
ncbi:MAG: NAD(P)/FAD-dependent oxidoreductase [Paracoccaceae bacterium]